MTVPLVIAMLLIGGVWAAGAVWSFEHQTEFATDLGFHIGELLPLVADGLPVALGAIAFNASLDDRPAFAARLATALAVAGSAVMNGMYAARRTDYDLTTIAVAMAVPVLAGIAFEVLLHEIRRTVESSRGKKKPPRPPVPGLRPIRLLLSPVSEPKAWRRHVLAVTDPAADPVSRAALTRLVAAVQDAERDGTTTPAERDTYEAPRWHRDGGTALGTGTPGHRDGGTAGRRSAPGHRDGGTALGTGTPGRRDGGTALGPERVRFPEQVPVEIERDETTDRSAALSQAKPARSPLAASAVPAGEAPRARPAFADRALTAVATALPAPVAAPDVARSSTPSAPSRPARPAPSRRAAATGTGSTAGGSQRRDMELWVREQRAAGRRVTGADVDRQFGTRDYGRRVLRDMDAAVGIGVPDGTA